MSGSVSRLLLPRPSKVRERNDENLTVKFRRVCERAKGRLYGADAQRRAGSETKQGIAVCRMPVFNIFKALSGDEGF